MLDQLDELVLKPVEGSGGYGSCSARNASARQLQKARKAIRDDPRGWIAQPVVQLSTVPTKVDDRLVPRHVDLRPFAVNDGDNVFVLPGGLTRVALPEGSLVVNSSQGGGSKDTWVLAAAGAAEGERELGEKGLAAVAPANSPAAELGPRAEHQPAQQQQQQQGDGSMLARNAESLYWIGRYVERADDTARILDVSVHQLLEDATVDTDRAARTLLAVLGCDPPDDDPLDAWAVTELVGYSDRAARLHRLVRLAARGRTPAAPARWSPARCGSASTPRGTPCPSASSTPGGWARTRSSPTSRTGRRCSPVWRRRR